MADNVQQLMDAISKSRANDVRDLLANVIVKNDIVYISMQTDIGACDLINGGLVNCVTLCASYPCPAYAGGMAFSDDMTTMFVTDQNSSPGAIFACGMGADGKSFTGCNNAFTFPANYYTAYVSIVGEIMFVVISQETSGLLGGAVACTFTASGATSVVNCPFPQGTILLYTEAYTYDLPYKLVFSAL